MVDQRPKMTQLKPNTALEYHAYRKPSPPFEIFHLLLPYNLELIYIKSDFLHLYLHIVTHNLQVKNKFYKFQKINLKYKTRIYWLDKCPHPYNNNCELVQM